MMNSRTSEDKVGIIDYGASNLLSIENAFAYLGFSTFRVNTAEEVKRAHRLILPGVGAFSTGMEQLSKRGLVGPIKDAASDGKPILGICLGMQLLGTSGYEGGYTRGLDLIKGEVRKIDTNERLPHVGWNNVDVARKNKLTEGLSGEPDFYFVHSYCFSTDDDESVIGNCFYGKTFPAIIQLSNIYGVQFHPEKSHKTGLKLISNFMEI